MSNYTREFEELALAGVRGSEEFITAIRRAPSDMDKEDRAYEELKWPVIGIFALVPSEGYAELARVFPRTLHDYAHYLLKALASNAGVTAERFGRGVDGVLTQISPERLLQLVQDDIELSHPYRPIILALCQRHIFTLSCPARAMGTVAARVPGL